MWTNQWKWGKLNIRSIFNRIANTRTISHENIDVVVFFFLLPFVLFFMMLWWMRQKDRNRGITIERYFPHRRAHISYPIMKSFGSRVFCSFDFIYSWFIIVDVVLFSSSSCVIVAIAAVFTVTEQLTPPFASSKIGFIWQTWLFQCSNGSIRWHLVLYYWLNCFIFCSLIHYWRMNWTRVNEEKNWHEKESRVFL